MKKLFIPSVLALNSSLMGVFVLLVFFVLGGTNVYAQNELDSGKNATSPSTNEESNQVSDDNELTKKSSNGDNPPSSKQPQSNTETVSVTQANQSEKVVESNLKSSPSVADSEDGKIDFSFSNSDDGEYSINDVRSLLESMENAKRELSIIQKSKSKDEEENEEISVREGILNEQIADLESQIDLAISGVDYKIYEVREEEDIDLKKELEQMLQPFVLILRNLTDQSRKVEKKRRDIAILLERHSAIEKALQSISLVTENIDKIEDEKVKSKIHELEKFYKERNGIVTERLMLLQRQVKNLVKERETGFDKTGSSFFSLIKQRGINLIWGTLAFLVVFSLIRFIYSFLDKLSKRGEDQPRSFSSRLFLLVMHLASVVLGYVAMLMVFNYQNDWLLMALGVFFLLGVGWLLISSIPVVFEQVTLLLNLGAVQEGERVIIDDVPWRVQELSFYSKLVNPLLQGGAFIVPVRNLSGIHSRPKGENEDWFPTKEGDWVLRDDDKIGQVILQTPEFVKLKRLGGALEYVPTVGFLESEVKNLSKGYRVESEFGIDYQHQSIATEQVLVLMREKIKNGMPELVPAETVKNIEIEFFEAGSSALIYEIEIDFDGSVAHEYEEIHRWVQKLLVDLCNEQGWVIPFQQITLHRAN